MEDEFQRLFGKRHPTEAPPTELVRRKGPRAQLWFAEEWTRTLDLMRRLARRFSKLSLSGVGACRRGPHHPLRPASARVLLPSGAEGEAEDRKSKTLVTACHARNRLHSDDALVEAARWCASLPEPPTENVTYNLDEPIQVEV